MILTSPNPKNGVSQKLMGWNGNHEHIEGSSTKPPGNVNFHQFIGGVRK